MNKRIIITSLLLLVFVLLSIFLCQNVTIIENNNNGNDIDIKLEITKEETSSSSHSETTITEIMNNSTKTSTKNNVSTTKTTNKKTTTTSNNIKNNLVSYNGWLSIKNNTLVNQYGEKIQLKGMSTHGIQWFPKYANAYVMRTLRDEWNSNLFRIAMYTEENGYISNPTLKNKVVEVVNNAINLNMYVIIDWHILSDGNPQTHKSEAIAFFSEMSRKYKNNPNVIYEICNEPNGNVTWNNDIKPYAEEVIAAIRANSPKSIIIVGTGTWSQDVDQAAMNPINDSRVMYALHFYAGTHKEWLRDRCSDALNKIPIFVSEWGMSDASGNGGVYKDEADKWISFMKNNNISWANWSLCDKNESSALLKPNTPSNNIDDSYLSKSGIYVKQYMKQ